MIVIDDFHKVRDPLLLKIVQGLALAINTLEGEVGLVIFSRSYSAHIPMRDAEGRIIAIPMELRGLDQDASRALLTGFDDLPDDEFRYIYGLAKGHPLVLELINRSTNTGAYHETLENYVSVEIISRLSAEQRRLLGARFIENPFSSGRSHCWNLIRMNWTHWSNRASLASWMVRPTMSTI